MNNKYLKGISVLSLIYIIIFFIDWMITLFTIAGDGTYYSFLGVQISQFETTNSLELITEFTGSIITNYMIFIVIGLLIIMVLTKVNNNDS